MQWIYFGQAKERSVSGITQSMLKSSWAKDIRTPGEARYLGKQTPQAIKFIEKTGFNESQRI